jgi:hypothetical protein
MRSTPEPTPARGDGAMDAQRRTPERERRFARRIECDGDGCSAAPRGPSRGGGMREPEDARTRDDLHG